MKHNLLIAFLTLFIVSCSAQHKVTNETLEGKWFLELEHNDIGLVRTVMNFETDSEKFEAYTRKKADKDILGGWTSMLGRTFTKSFKDGSLLRVVNGTHRIENDTLKLDGVFTSAMGNFHFRGYVINDELYAKLTNRIGERTGLIKGSKKEQKLPLEDYPSLFEKSIMLTESKIYNKEILQTKEWKKFVKKMRKVTQKTQDDLEIVFAFFYYADKLPFSHYALLKIPENQKENQKSAKQRVFLEDKTPQTAYLKITSFDGSVTEMDSIFSIIKQKKYKNLIVDLRNNSGGNVEAGMTFATNVVDSTFYGGVFLTQKWFNQHKELPTPKDYVNFQHFTDANFDLIIEGIHNTEGLCLKVIPQQTTYKGNLYILTNEKNSKYL